MLRSVLHQWPELEQELTAHVEIQRSKQPTLHPAAEEEQLSLKEFLQESIAELAKLEITHASTKCANVLGFVKKAEEHHTILDVQRRRSQQINTKNITAVALSDVMYLAEDAVRARERKWGQTDRKKLGEKCETSIAQGSGNFEQRAEILLCGKTTNSSDTRSEKTMFNLLNDSKKYDDDRDTVEQEAPSLRLAAMAQKSRHRRSLRKRRTVST